LIPVLSNSHKNIRIFRHAHIQTNTSQIAAYVVNVVKYHGIDEHVSDVIIHNAFQTKAATTNL